MSEPPLLILFVDDDILFLDVVKNYLTKQGFIVDIAISGIQALQKITGTEFDVIVSDYLMPGMDGIELLKEIRKKNPYIPFILFTGRGREDVVIDAIENGADFYLRKGEKPVPQFSELAQKIRGAVQNRKESRAFRESEWKFRALVEYSLDGTFILDPRGKILFANNTAVQILDVQNPSELIGNRNVMEFVTPESMDDVIRDFDTVAGGVDGYVAQYKILTEKHEERWVESIGKTIHYLNAPSILISLRDVTDRKLAEDKLRKTSNEMHQIFSNMTNAFIVCESVFDDYGKYVSFRFGYFNDAFAKIFKIHYEDAKGKDVFDVWPETEQSWVEVFSHVAVTGIPHTFDMYHESTKGWYHCNAYRPTDSPDLICVIIEDITDRRMTEELLRETNAYLDNLITNANVPIIVWDPSFHITRINHSFELLIGRLEQDIISKPLSILFPPDQVDYSIRLMDTTRDGVQWETLQIELQHKNGSIKTVLWNSSTIYGPDGSTPVATIAQGRDITSETILKTEKEAAVLQIQENIAQLAILNDGIRNPLMVISAYIDLITDPKITETIQSQIRQIDTMVFNLDKEWIQSEKILEYLRKQGEIIDGFNQISSSKIQEPGESLQKNTSRYINPLSANHLFLEELQAQLYSILDSIDAFIYVADMVTYDLLYVNKQGRTLFGDIIGQKCYKTIQKDMCGPCSFCTNHLLTNNSGPTGVFQWESQNTQNDRWFDCRDRAIRWTDGRLVRLEIATDITERKRTEESLRFAQEKFTKAFISSPDAFIISELENGQFIEINDAASKIFGFSPEEMIGKSALELGIWSKTEDIADFFTQIKNHGRVEGYELLGCRKSGDLFDALISAEIITLDGKNHLLSTVRDITERKNSEDPPCESEQKMGNIFMNSPVALTVVSAENGVFVDVNEAFIRTTGFTREKLIGSTAEDLGLFPDIEEHYHMISLLRDQKALYGFKISCRNASGEIRFCQFSSRIILMGSSPHVISSIEDISESSAAKSAFEALVRSMVGTTGINALQKITENISSWLKADCVMVGEIQPDNKNVKVLSMLLDGKEISDFTYSLKGTPCENVAEKGFCLYPDNAALLFPESQDLRELNIRGYIGTPLWNSEGEVFGILCALFRDPIKPLHSVREIMDIIAVKAAAEIERTQIEQTLRENQQMLAEAMNMANLASWEYDVIKDLFTFNGPFYALYGTTTEREGGNQMTSETYARKFVYPEDIPFVAKEVEKAKNTTDPDFLSQQEHRIIRKNGEIRYITVRIRITKDAQGRTIRTHGVNQDITERRRSEEVFRKANRQLNLLTSITRHDILNNISVIYAYLELVKQKYSDPELLEYLRVMIMATEEIQSQIEFTRVYEELGSHEPQWVQLDRVMPRSSLPDSMTLTTDLTDIYLFADPMLQKVFFALLDNSVRHGQRVTEIRVFVIDSDNNLTVVWEDNGLGVVLVEKETIFEQGLGKNTGLGLFLVREILLLTGITISETGIPGMGARFEICVPKGAFRRTTSP